MVWLFVLGLVGWVGFLSVRLSDARTRLQWLERRVTDLKDALDRRNPEAESAQPRSVALEPQVAAPVVDTPRPKPAGVRPPDQAIAARDTASEPHLEAPTVSPARPAGPSQAEIRAWLEENGLAWAGGGALALGGLFLVAYAAQQGFFTPPLRIAAAVVLGFVMVGASEWLKRRSGHPLAAGVAAGAGAATLYGAAWASYWLYAFIGLPVAGGLLAAISFGLLALAFRHGEPLAILAILGGFLAPAITGPQHWTAPALTGYLGLITLTGYGVTALRGWGRAGLATLAGAFLWGVAGFFADGFDRVVALALAPLVLAAAAGEWGRRKGGAVIGDGTVDTLTLGPLAALLAAALLVAATPLESTSVTICGLGGAGLALATAYAARRGLIPPAAQVLGWLPALSFGLLFRPAAAQLPAYEAWDAGLCAVLAAAGAWSATGRPERVSRISAGLAAAVVFALITRAHGPIADAAPWAPGALAALVLLAAGAWVARTTEKPETDLALALWIWGAGACGLYALPQALPSLVLPLGAAGVSLAAAVAHARIGWRGFAGVMLSAAAGVLAALMTPDQFYGLADGKVSIMTFAAVFAASAALVYAGAWIATRAPRPREAAEAQSTLALVVTVAGVGVLLRLLASDPSHPMGGRMDLFTEASLRTLTILVAGLSAAQAVRADSSIIGRWRGQVLLLLGLGQAVIFEAMYANPLWAWWTPPVAGPRILDSLAVGFLAPAALLAIATWKKVSINRWLLAIYALGAALFLGLWSLEETRRLFQGASLHAGFDAIGRAEAAAYAVLALAGARGLVWLGERAAVKPMTLTPFSREIVAGGRWGAWGALAFALLVLGWGASPWWGPIDRPLAGPYATALLFALYAAACGTAFLTVAPAERADARFLARGARLSVVVIAFALLNLIVRFAFRGYDMRPTLQEASLETWTFSAVWGLYGFGLLVVGAARRSNDLRFAGLVALALTLAKIFLFDMAHLQGVVRAGSFLAVGALLLVAAVVVRRLGGGATLGLGRAGEQEAAEPNKPA